MNTLSAPQVLERLSQNPDLKLVMTLSPTAFSKCHIPQSINIWNLELAEEQLPKEAEIIVYCSDHSCQASYQAYRGLEKLGYQNIWRFSGGLREWSEAGFTLETSI